MELITTGPRLKAEKTCPLDQSCHAELGTAKSTRTVVSMIVTISLAITRQRHLRLRVQILISTPLELLESGDEAIEPFPIFDFLLAVLRSEYKFPAFNGKNNFAVQFDAGQLSQIARNGDLTLRRNTHQLAPVWR
jgi:hypothetical protein